MEIIGDLLSFTQFRCPIGWQMHGRVLAQQQNMFLMTKVNNNLATSNLKSGRTKVISVISHEEHV